MTKYDIIAELAAQRRVEEIVRVVCKVARSDLDDLSQMIYEAMLLYNDEKILSLYTKGQINYFIVAVVRNQFYSDTSQYHYAFRKYQLRAVNVDAVANIPDDDSL